MASDVKEIVTEKQMERAWKRVLPGISFTPANLRPFMRDLLADSEVRRAVVADVVREAGVPSSLGRMIGVAMESASGAGYTIAVPASDLLSALFPGSPDGE